MSEDGRMRAFLERVVRALVAHPDEAKVDVVDGRRSTCFEVRTRAEDRGQVIGKDGMTVRSLRTLAAISAKRHRRRFDIELPD